MPSPPKVFLSYSHDSRDHQDQVLALADRLRSDGIDAELDQYELSPAEGWPEWTERQVREAEFVLVISTETYRRRFDRVAPEGDGLGVKWEGSAIRRALYEAEGLNKKYLPVVFAQADLQHIPGVLRGTSHYDLSTEEGYEALYRRLTSQPSTRKPKLGKLRELPSRERSEDWSETGKTDKTDKIVPSLLPPPPARLLLRLLLVACLGVAAVSIARVLTDRTHRWEKYKAEDLPGKRLLGICMTADGKDGWAVGNGGVRLRWNDREGQWQIWQDPLKTDANINDIWINPVDGSDGWATAWTPEKDGGLLLRWNGEKWESEEYEVSLNKIWLNPQNKNGWVVGNLIEKEGGLVIGLEWADGIWEKRKIYAKHDLNAVWLTEDGKIGWAVGDQGVLRQWDGASWKEPQEEPKQDLTAVWLGANGRSGWAVGDGVILSLKADDWDPVSPQGLTGLAKIRLESLWLNREGSEGWAVGQNGVVLRFEEGTWRPSPEATKAAKRLSLMDLWIAPNGRAGWAVGFDNDPAKGGRAALMRYESESIVPLEFNTLLWIMAPALLLAALAILLRRSRAMSEDP